MKSGYEEDKRADYCEQELVFYVRVQFRRNTSMQGTIKWIDGHKSSSFRSALELGNLICSACASNLVDIEKKLTS